MPVSFYAQISIIFTSFAVASFQFLGLSHAASKVITIALALVIFLIAGISLYKGFVFLMRREEQRMSRAEGRTRKKEQQKDKDSLPAVASE